MSGFRCALARLRLPDIDGGSIKRVLQVRRIKLLDHLDAGAAIFGDLLDIGAFHEAQTNVGVTQAVRGAPVSVPVEFELGPVKDTVEQFYMVTWEDRVGRLR